MKLTNRLFFALALLITVFSLPAIAEENAADHQELRKILSDVQNSINNKEFKDVEKYLRPDVLITFQDAEVVKGVEGASEYLERKLTGGNAVLKDHHLTAQADEISNIIGNVAIAHGSATQDFKFAAGMEIKLDSKWTATLIKENGTWKAAAIHMSSNVFDNPLLTTAQKNLLFYLLGGFIAGLLTMFLGRKIFRNKK